MLPVEGRLASFDGATSWLNSEPLTPEGLRGRVVLVDFWTYTCINWLRTLPYVRAWAAKYADAGLTIVGVHTPEFGFERDLDNIVAQSRDLGVDYPIAVDSDYGVWGEFANHYWPAVYIADAEGRHPLPPLRRGRVRHDRDGDPAAPRRRRRGGPRPGPGDGRPAGLEVAADWRSLRSPETYLGYGQSSGSPRRTPRSTTARTSTRAREPAAQHVGPHRRLDASPRTPPCSNEAGGRDRVRSSTRATSTSSWDRRPRGASIPFRVLARRPARRRRARDRRRCRRPRDSHATRTRTS